MDIEKIVKNAVEAKKAIIGADRAMKALDSGELSAVVIASNCPKALEERLAHRATLSSVTLHKFSGTSSGLGSICKKPFSVLVVGVKN